MGNLPGFPLSAEATRAQAGPYPMGARGLRGCSESFTGIRFYGTVELGVGQGPFGTHVFAAD
jgi:hypothetical protein